MKSFICFLFIAVLASLQTITQSFRTLFSKPKILNHLVSSKLFSTTLESNPSPGSPVVKSLNKETSIAQVSVTLSKEMTQRAFDQSCELYNNEVKNRKYKIPGFRPGAKLPASYLFQMFGESTVKLLCAKLLSEDIQAECDKTGLIFVGRGRILDFKEDSFVAGMEHTIDIECDLWPTIMYKGDSTGYKGLEVTVTKGEIDLEKFDKVKQSIQERYKVLSPTPQGYAAKMGDVVVANMRGFERAPDGSRGSPLPAVASGDKVEIVLEKGKFMEGLVEGIEGLTAGATKSIEVKFPVRPGGVGAALSGKETIFEVEVLEVKVKTLPDWNEELAKRVRDGMDLKGLEDEVRKALEGDDQNSTENIRNEALAKSLLDIMTISKIPESLLEETIQERFQSMLMDFKEQGSTQEQLEEMTSPEKYAKYKEISMPNAEKIVKLGLAFRDISEKEKVAVPESEIQEQIDLLRVQARQKGETMPDERNARDQIENTLLRRKVFECIAGYSKITWIDQTTS